MKITIKHIIDLEFPDLKEAYEFMEWLPENNIAITYFELDNRLHQYHDIKIRVMITNDEDYLAFKMRWL